MIGTVTAVEAERTRKRPLVDMYHTNDHRRKPRPPLTAGRLVDRPAILQIHRNPVLRVSPWPIVFVEIRPKAPPCRSRSKPGGRNVRLGLHCRGTLDERHEPVEIRFIRALR